MVTSALIIYKLSKELMNYLKYSQRFINWKIVKRFAKIVFFCSLSLIVSNEEQGFFLKLIDNIKISLVNIYT